MSALKSYAFPNSFRFGAPLARSLEANFNGLVETATPAYDIVQHGEDSFTIVVAVPGLDDADIDITEHKGRLSISFKEEDAPKGEDTSNVTVLRRGIQARRAALDFKLGEHVYVDQANLEKGLLSITLVRHVPEELQPKQIHIGGTP